MSDLLLCVTDVAKYVWNALREIVCPYCVNKHGLVMASDSV